MLQKGQEKRMKNYNAKTAIKFLAEKPRKTKGLSMPCISGVHGNNDTPRFHASDEKQEMMLKKERSNHDIRILSRRYTGKMHCR